MGLLVCLVEIHYYFAERLSPHPCNYSHGIEQIKGSASEHAVAFQVPLPVSPPPQLEVPIHILTHPLEDVSPTGSKSNKSVPVCAQFVYGIALTVRNNKHYKLITRALEISLKNVF